MTGQSWVCDSLVVITRFSVFDMTHSALLTDFEQRIIVEMTTRWGSPPKTATMATDTFCAIKSTKEWTDRVRVYALVCPVRMTTKEFLMYCWNITTLVLSDNMEPGVIRAFSEEKSHGRVFEGVLDAR